MIIELANARAHIRDATAPDDQLITYLRAAEQTAEQFLSRRVFPNALALNLAVAEVPTILTLAGAARDAAVIIANTIGDGMAREMAIEQASDAYRVALYQAQEIQCGIVVTDLVKAAILLIFGHLYVNREDSVIDSTVADLPQGSKSLLQPYRRGLGV